jgi:hypothetical protein
MTNGNDEVPWPAQFTKQMQQASEEWTQQQLQWFNRLASAGAGSEMQGFGGLPAIDQVGTRMAVFKTRVQSGGRISIPDAEREALNIEEGDIVQTFVIPIKQSHGDPNE